MISKDVLTKIKEIEIQTRRLLSGMLVGDNNSAIKGAGFEFDQIREYSQGDDVRFIDWNSSTRNNTLLIKQFIEERSRTVILAIDCSSSMFFSSTDQLKYEAAAQIASVLALVAGYGKDHVGLFLYSDDIHVAIEPKSGANHVRTIMHTALSQKNRNNASNSSAVFDAIAHSKKRDSIVFLISDFLNDPDAKKMSVLSRKHDVIAIRCLDRYEKKAPAIGAIRLVDSLQNNPIALLLQRKKNRKMNDFLYERLVAQDQLFKKYAVDLFDIETNKPFVADLVRFFRKCMMY